MDTIGKASGVLAIIFAILSLIGGSFSLGTGFGEFTVRKQAIEAKAGQWTIDPETGVKEFQWNSR